MYQHWNTRAAKLNQTNKFSLEAACMTRIGIMTMICSRLTRIPIHKILSWRAATMMIIHQHSNLKAASFFLTGKICQKLKLKMKIWKFSPGLDSRGFQGQKSENNINNNKSRRRITMFGFQYLGKNIKTWSNICTWYLVDSQISQDLLKDDCHFYYILLWMIAPLAGKINS